MRKGLRIATIVVGVLVIAGLVVGIVATRTVRRGFPKTQGTIEVDGLDSPVEIYRDDHGIPHIYADTKHDLFFAQGYVHAQDRFWQMEFWRHIGQGRVAEMMGEPALSSDMFIRTVGWHRVAEAELDLIDQESLAILEAYSEGVNAYVDTHNRNQMGLEFAILGLTGAEWEIEPWTPLNTLTWAKVMAWDLGANMDSELERVDLMQRVGVDMTAELYPPYSEEFPVTIPDASVIEQVSSELDLGGGFDPDTNFAFGPGDSVGSNNWVLSGDLTDTGAPLLANDPHLGIQMPSIWYEIGLHCNQQGPDCPYELTGFSFAGAPGIIIGHNDNIAWGFTNTSPDVQDLYIERINPANPSQYEVNGEWVDMETIREEIVVAGQDEPVVVNARLTRNGPIISDLDSFAERQGYTLVDGEPALTALAFRWTALEPGLTYQAVLELDRAQNFGEFVAALESWDVPGQNMVYADRQGNIGLQVTSEIPIRANGNGTVPVPGWTDDYQWTGYIPYEEMPRTYNPPEGYILTANHAMVGPDYPYLITTEWTYGYRAQRIEDMLEAGMEGDEPISAEFIAQMQGDNMNLSALEVIPALEALDLADPGAQTAQEMLLEWDGQMHMDSPQAALYAVFWSELVKATFYDGLPEDLWLNGGDRTMVTVANLLDQPDNLWWDDVTTPDTETRDEILASALESAYAETTALLGDDPTRWAWGDLHTSTFDNQTLGNSGISVIESIFNRGPVATSGGDSIVNATAWNVPEGFEVSSVPSMRQIIDVGDFSASLTMHTTGQSGHPYNPHYDDMIDPWRNIEYHPMLWDETQVQAAAKDHLTLTPR
jgi:penicillin amidase